MSHATEQASFRASLSTFDLSMIVVGAVIGSGIFLTPSMVADALRDRTLIIAIWIGGGAMAIAGALTFSELANVRPKVGGIYAYLSEAYSPQTGFLYGWCILLVMNSGSLAALCIACIRYSSNLIPMSAAMQKTMAIGVIVFLTAANIAGVRQGSMLSNVFSLTKIIGIGAIILGALFLRHPAIQEATLAPSTSDIGTAFATAMVGVLWSYGGWQYATFPAAEARDASRSIPRAIVIGIVIVVVLYIAVNLGYLSVLSVAGVAHEQHVASKTAEVLAGSSGAAAVSALIALSTFGTASVYTLSAPRISYAMANDGVFFPALARVHPRTGTPVMALLVQCVVVCLYVLAGSFEELISYVAFVDWIFYALAAGAALVFRRTLASVPRTYRIPGYPVTPVAFILVSIWFVLYLYAAQPIQSTIGLSVLLTGVPVYSFWKSRVSRQPERR